jgi:hypothetical protein
MVFRSTVGPKRSVPVEAKRVYGVGTIAKQNTHIRKGRASDLPHHQVGDHREHARHLGQHPGALPLARPAGVRRHARSRGWGPRGWAHDGLARLGPGCASMHACPPHARMHACMLCRANTSAAAPTGGPSACPVPSSGTPGISNAHAPHARCARRVPTSRTEATTNIHIIRLDYPATIL